MIIVIPRKSTNNIKNQGYAELFHLYGKNKGTIEYGSSKSAFPSMPSYQL